MSIPNEVRIDHCQTVTVLGREILTVYPSGSVKWGYQTIDRDTLVSLTIACLATLIEANIINQSSAGITMRELLIDQIDSDITDLPTLVVPPSPATTVEVANNQTFNDDMPY